jgi:hypothetical protein
MSSRRVRAKRAQDARVNSVLYSAKSLLALRAYLAVLHDKKGKLTTESATSSAAAAAGAIKAEADVPDASLYAKALDTYNTQVDLFMEEEDVYVHFDTRGLIRGTDITKQVLFSSSVY